MAKVKDFFISYTGADVAWAEWVAQTLEDTGYTTVLQAWDFRPGDNFIQRMNQALADADRVIAVLSAAYFASEYTWDEWTAALVRARGERDRLLPVRIEAVELPPLLAGRIYLDLVGLEEQTAAARLVAGVQPGRVKQPGKRPYPGGQAKAAGVSFPGRRPEIFEVPPRGLHFTGRGDLLAALRRHLVEARSGAVVQAGAVYGLGGVGKTQLAVEYAHRYAADYELVWWVPAEQPATISGRLAQLGRRLGLEELPSLEEQVGVVFDALGQRDRWLLVYDNVQQPADLEGLRPPGGGGQVLITSRNPAWGGVAATVWVDVLSRQEAVAFLQLRAGSGDQATLQRLAAMLGDLPLALEQAAAYMEETVTTPAQYLELLHDNEPKLFALGQPATTQQTIATTWMVSLERLRSEAPAAEDLLCLFAFMAPDDLPRALLTDYTDRLPERLAGVVGSRVGFGQALGALRRYSLVTVTEEKLSVHRLLQQVIRDRLDLSAVTSQAGTVVRLLAEAFPAGGFGDPRVWPWCAQLLPHAVMATEHAERYQAEPAATSKLLDKAGRYLHGRAGYVEAAALLKRALAIREATLGPDHPDTAQSLNNLAGVLHDQGDPTGARGLYERALVIREATLGPEHPDTAWSLNRLATVLYNQGDLAGARRLFKRSLAICEARLGPEHPDTAWSLNNLAMVLHDQGDLDGARPLCERALAISESRLGPDHPLTAWSLNNLGNLLRDQGDLDGARRLHERAAAIYEARLGPDHSWTAWTLSYLALVLAEQGDLDGARALQERVLAIREARLGPDHPATVRTRQNLATVRAAIGHRS